MQKIHTGPRRFGRSFHSRFSQSLRLSRACCVCSVWSVPVRSLAFWKRTALACHCRKRRCSLFATATAAPAHFVSIEEHIEHFEFGFSWDWDIELIKREFLELISFYCISQFERFFQLFFLLSWVTQTADRALLLIARIPENYCELTLILEQIKAIVIEFVVGGQVFKKVILFFAGGSSN